MKTLFAEALLVTATALSASAAPLAFDKSAGTPGELALPRGGTVRYTAYEGLRYAENVEDETCQTMNLYVPDGAGPDAPVFLRTYVGGYMAAKAAAPQAGDATGRALAEGFVVAIPGSRGRNSVRDGAWTGRAPNGLLDLKAAVRYLRRFARDIPADAERIVTDGTSAGGAMSALLGATGNAPEYAPLLERMGAANERDDVFAAVCFCPITDLEHADMAYEWLYGGTASRRGATDGIRAVSAELAAAFPAYVESLGLGLDAEGCLDAVKREIIRSAQIAKDAGADIPQDIGFAFSEEAVGGAPPIDGGKRGGGGGDGGAMPAFVPEKRPGEYITDLDMAAYLDYVVSTQPLKTAPAFDTLGVAGQSASGENDEFGDATGTSANFTAYSAAKNGGAVTPEVAANVHLLNPMDFIGADGSDVAPHWYIRHGARDRDTAFTVPFLLARKLERAGKDVDFLLPWNRPHSGDYALDELFSWLKEKIAR